jgi:hypothetical protein
MSHDPLLMLDSKIHMLDRAAGPDDRVAAVPGRPPVGRAEYARLRNGYVFHEVGMCAASGRLAGTAAAITDRLVTGRIDPFFCAQNFVRGWLHERGRRAAPPTAPDVAAALAHCREPLTSRGFGTRFDEIGRAIARVAAGRRDLRWFLGAVRRRVRRSIAEASGRPRS